MKIKAYDKYQKVNVEIYPSDDELWHNINSHNSYGSYGSIPFTFHSLDVEDYELGRWSDLENLTIEPFDINSIK